MTQVKWYPIDTVPRDYSTVLLFAEDTIVTGYWSTLKDKYFDAWGEVEIEDPTHWARLPDGPEES